MDDLLVTKELMNLALFKEVAQEQQQQTTLTYMLLHLLPIPDDFRHILIVPITFLT